MTTKSFISTRNVVMAVTAVAIAAAAAFAYSKTTNDASQIAQPSVSASGASASVSRVAATVNGKAIYDSELLSGVNQGVDRAVVVDRYINKVLAADLARTAYSKDAAEALQGAEREVLSQLYVARKTEELRAGVTAVAIRAFYDANVKVEDYAGYKVKYAVAADEKEAGEIAATIAGGKAKDVEARFKPVKEGADGFVLANELPYGLGGVVRTLKKGEYSRPVTLRNGYFILFLEDMKANPKPELAKVSDEIKNVIVAKAMTESLTTARTTAKVELR